MDKLISQQAAIDKIKKRLFETAFNNVGIKQNIDDTLVDVAENRLENWFNELPSVQPDPCEDAVSRKAVLSMIDTYMNKSVELHYLPTSDGIKKLISILPSVQPDTTTHDSISTETGKNDGDGTSGECIGKTGYWIKDRSGAYCCSKCMEPCATYVMMKPRDKFCKMCGSRNEVTE